LKIIAAEYRKMSFERIGRKIGSLKIVLYLSIFIAAESVACRLTGCGVCSTAPQDVAKVQIFTFQGALQFFGDDTGRLPTTTEGLDALMTCPGALNGWKGPYVSDLPLDPWGRPYIYLRDSEGYSLRSYGRDGLPGGEGEDADLIIGE
jgi:general secretion pathway protein G